MAANPKTPAQSTARRAWWMRTILMVFITGVGIGIIVWMAKIAAPEKPLVCDSPAGAATSLIGFGGCHEE
jgi:predicted cobalt transporter CbtA